MFEVKFVNENANAEFLALPTKLRAKMAHTILLLQDFGTLGEPHSKKLQDGLFELKGSRGHSTGDLQLRERQGGFDTRGFCEKVAKNTRKRPKNRKAEIKGV